MNQGDIDYQGNVNGVIQNSLGVCGASFGWICGEHSQMAGMIMCDQNMAQKYVFHTYLYKKLLSYLFV